MLDALVTHLSTSRGKVQQYYSLVCLVRYCDSWCQYISKNN